MFAALLAWFGGLAWVDSAPAADTTEPFDPGFSDVDFYVGVDGLNVDAGERRTFGEVMIGYGINSRLSGYVGKIAMADGYLTDGRTGLYLGLFGNVFDGDHVDVDLFGDLAVDGEEESVMALTPGVELNLDLRPERSLAGVYLRVKTLLYGLAEATEEGARFPGLEVGLALETTAGVYWTVSQRHQVLLELDSALHRGAAILLARVSAEALSLGYNVVLTESIELINQLGFVAEDGRLDLGFSVGFIATLPTAR